METLRNDAVHGSQSIRSALSCIGTHHIDELSKEKEDELLYGADEDGDEEEALSDDSMRLRLSDDEDVELDEVVIPLERDDQQASVEDNKTRSESEETVTAKPLPEAEKMKIRNKTGTSDEPQQEHSSEESNNGQKVTEVVNHVELKDSSTVNVSALNEVADEKLVPPLINSEDNDNIHETGDQISATKQMSNNVHDCNGLEKREEILTNGIEYKNNVKNIDTPVEEDRMDNEEITKAVGITAKSEVNTITENIAETLQQPEPDKEMVSDNKNNTVHNSMSQETGINKPTIEIESSDVTATNHVQETEALGEAQKEIKENSQNVLNASEKNIPPNENRDVVQPCDTISQNADNTEKVLAKCTNIELQETNLKPVSVKDIVKCEKRRLSIPNDSPSALKVCRLIPPAEQLPVSNSSLQAQNKDNSKECMQMVEDEISTAVEPVNKQSESAEEIKSTTEGNNINSTKETLNNTMQKCDIQSEVSIKKDSSSIRDSSLATVMDKNVEITNSEKSNTEVPVAPRRRGRRKKVIAEIQETVSQEIIQVKDGGRQKRRTAKNAEEIIRKKFLSQDSDLESSDDSEKFVAVNHKVNQEARSSSPPSLKRNCPDGDTTIVNGGLKKVKVNSEVLSDEMAMKDNSAKNIKSLSYVRKFFQRDLKNKLPKLKQEELEELLIQKIVETITMRGEIGRLREQARISEKNQEATRARCQQLAKQIKDFEMVLTRYTADRRTSNEKLTPPIKINRSVGLQVNFITEHGMQNLRQLQQNISNGNNSTSSETNTNAVSPRRGIKIRPPRRSEPPAPVQTTVTSQSHIQSPQVLSTVTPAALVVAKPIDSQHNLPLPTQTTNKIQHVISSQQQPQQQTIVLNGKLPNQGNRPETMQTVNKSRTNDLIDLTDEEEKSKAAINAPSVTTTITDQQINLTPKSQQCFQRVIQAIPGNVAVTGQPASIRVVQPASQPTPTALVNNMHSPRLTYVMQNGIGSTRQLLITSNASQIRPVNTNRSPFSTLTYKTASTIATNGTVRVLTTPTTTTVQLNQHPAPLPDTPSYAVNPVWKLPPPAPSLKISKVANGIVLSWNMTLSDKYADIVSYQLYAYQEVSGVPPSTALWKKVGDVRALPLPMACTLTQFSKGNNYYFAVRAVDTHSRKGQYSIPGNISL